MKMYWNGKDMLWVWYEILILLNNIFWNENVSNRKDRNVWFLHKSWDDSTYKVCK